MKKTLSFVLLLLLSKAAFSLGFGQIQLYSYLNEPLDAEIELLGTDEVDLNNTMATLASVKDFEKVNLARPFFLSRLQFKIIKQDARVFILLTTNEPVQQAFLDFLVLLHWPEGRLVRGYTLLFDPAPKDAPRRRERPTRNDIEASPESAISSLITPPSSTEALFTEEAQQPEPAVLPQTPMPLPAEPSEAAATEQMPLRNKALDNLKHELGDELFNEVASDIAKNGGKNLPTILQREGRSFEDVIQLLIQQPVEMPAQEPMPEVAPMPTDEEPLPVEAPEPTVETPLPEEKLTEEKQALLKHNAMKVASASKDFETFVQNQTPTNPAPFKNFRAQFSKILPALDAPDHKLMRTVILTISTLAVIGFWFTRRFRKRSPQAIEKALKAKEKKESPFDEEFQVRFDLAKQYLQVNDRHSAEEILAEVLTYGSQKEQEAAQALLNKTP